jgi:hypothetical protein
LVSWFAVSIDDIEEQTGLDFLWMLNDAQEDLIEGATATVLWAVAND